MFKKLKRGVKKDLEGPEKVVITKVDKTKAIKDACRSGNILQLVSRVTGHTLQWMSSKETLDGLGCLDNDAKSTLWTVNLVADSIKEGFIIQLHNEGFYLCIADGETKLTEYEDPAAAGDETLLKVSIVEQFIRLESADDCGHHIGILNNGDLKAAIATGTEMEAHFAPKVIFSTPIENGDHLKNSTEIINGGGVELEPVETPQETESKSKEDINKEESEEKPEKKKSKLKKLKESFRKRSKSQELLAKKDVENKDSKEEIEVTETVETPETTEDAPKTEEITTENTDITVSTESPEVVDADKIEVVESTNESDVVTNTS